MTAIFQPNKRYLFWNNGDVTIVCSSEFKRMSQLGELGVQSGEFRYGSVYVWNFSKCDVQCLFSDVEMKA